MSVIATRPPGARLLHTPPTTARVSRCEQRFDAVTHALLDAKMTEATGKSLGRAIDLVDAVDEIMGEEAGVGATGSFVSTSMSSEPPSTPWPAVKSFCANTTTLFITRVFRSAFA